jgi:hypothetical protein
MRYGFASFGSGSAKPKDKKTLIIEDEIAARKIVPLRLYRAPALLQPSLWHESGTGFHPFFIVE